MQISNDDTPHSKSSSDPDDMDVSEYPEYMPASEQGEPEVDVLPDAGSDSEASDPAEGEPEVEEPEEYELEDEDDEIEESRSPSVAAAPAKSPLKIKFKVRRGAVTRGRRTRAAVQVESEDSPESSEEEMPQNVRLTKRQAALVKARKGIVSSETSADEEREPAPARKKRGSAALDPSELALRKEESARKRRNVSEKKLQNEKAETINRLLKKQSRPRTKRTTALSTATPVEPPTPTPVGDVADAIDETPLPEPGPDIDGDVRMNDAPAAPPPTMYRWISTSRPNPISPGAEDTKSPDMHMHISFSVPPSMSISFPPQQPAETQKAEVRAPALCGVDGCGQTRRYRLVGGEWGAGACGMSHLKVLEAAR
ncbi:hypothetical protein C8R47DRAFT_1136049 [Mycena vitilis]|nr:hypothetical protein C8R47DRAFT_1136049 [Mycena vitilis]